MSNFSSTESSLYQDITKSREVEELIKDKKVDLKKQKNSYNVYHLTLPYFKKIGNKINYGNYVNGWKPIIESKIKTTLGNGSGYTNFQLMTLREEDRPLYDRVTSGIKKLPFAFNIDTREYVKFDVNEPALEKQVRKEWRNARFLNLPYNYLNRDFVNVSESFFTDIYGGPKIVLGEGSGGEMSDYEETEEEKKFMEQRSNVIQSAQKEIKDSLLKKYPDLDKSIYFTRFENLNLLIDPNFLLPSVYVEYSSLVYVKEFKIMWDSKYLSRKDFDEAVDTAFCKTIYDIIDHLKYSREKTIWRDAFYAAVLDDKANAVSRERLNYVTSILQSIKSITTKSLKEQADYFKK